MQIGNPRRSYRDVWRELGCFDKALTHKRGYRGIDREFVR